MGISRTVILGRITQDLELKQTPNGVSVLSFTVAVDRNYTKGEEKQSDYISCVAWKERAEFISRYFGKGRMIAVEGQLRTRTYEDKNGSKHYVTEVYVDNASFTGEKKAENQPAMIGNPDDYEDILSDDGATPF
jgi:single-strand DNA-binding protein